MRRVLIALLICLPLLVSAQPAYATLMNLTGFEADQGVTVTDVNGEPVVTFEEQESSYFVGFVNEKYMVSDDEVVLSFKYLSAYRDGLQADREDYFLLLLGENAADENLPYEVMNVSAGHSGLFTVNLTPYLNSSNTLYIEWRLLSNDELLGSYAELRNITLSPAPVPEPSTLILLTSGAVGMAWVGRRRLFS